MPEIKSHYADLASFFLLVDIITLHRLDNQEMYPLHPVYIEVVAVNYRSVQAVSLRKFCLPSGALSETPPVHRTALLRKIPGFGSIVAANMHLKGATCLFFGRRASLKNFWSLRCWHQNNATSH